MSIPKKRVNDLAKEAGTTGKELVDKLRSWGFDSIKSPQSTLTLDEELRARAMMEARGVMKEAKAAASDETSEEHSGGLVLKKKKKKKADEGSDETHVEHPAAAVEPEPVVELRPVQREFTPPPHSPEPEVEEVEERLTVEATEHDQPASSTERPLAAQHERVHSPEPAAPRQRATEQSSSPEPVARPAAARSGAPETTLEAAAHGATHTAAHPAAPHPATHLTTHAAPPAPAHVDPTKVVSKPKGVVLGRIDLSKLKSQQAKKAPESRRLRGKDDVAPEVRPTQGTDKKKGVVRGDRGTRGTLTSGQLREREAGRFLRRSQAASGRGPGGPGGPSSGGYSHMRPRDPNLSAYAGKVVEIDAPVTVKKLAHALSMNPGSLLKMAFERMGFGLGSINLNSLLDEDMAVLMANEAHVELRVVTEVEAEQELIQEIKKQRKGVDSEELSKRPPTVAFLGHVDHGKTTLIDTIRNSNVAQGEAGGITQHIGAYQVTTKKGHTLTIIDTPGHAAFTAMRARGAQAVDIVVLVVAADDGPMPSTEEALAHARAAKVPVVVALTKIDKTEANIERAKQRLAGMGLTSEEWGGETAMIAVSALKKVGVEELLERVFLESEVLELLCHPKGPAQGVVLEAEINEGKGIVAHLLVQDGTLRRGDVILAGEGYGKVRAMHDDRGKLVDAAPPAMPVEVTGLTELPGVGETFYVVQDLASAKEVAEERARKTRALSLTERRSVTAESLSRAVADQSRKSINLVVRADVQGSVEVLRGALSELKHEEVEVKVLHAGVGAVTENDVNLASTTGAIVIAFHVGVNDKARAAAERTGVEIRYYEVIYEMLDHIRDLMEGTLSPQLSEEITGHVEVRTLFRSSKFGLIAGSHVLDGSVFRDSKLRLLRDGNVVFSGQIGSLRREKDEAKEVRAGFDCGITIKDFQDLREHDVIEAIRTVTVKRTLGQKANA